MATYVDILKSEFPEIDCEVFDYITGESRGQAGTGRGQAGDRRGQPGAHTLSAGHTGAACRGGRAAHSGL